MKRWIVFTVCLLSYFSFSEVQARVVYENVNSGRPGLVADNPCGDEVTLAGENRIIISILIGVAQVGGVEGEASFQLTLYKNDGTDGVPNTILWESPWHEDYPIDEDESHVNFQVPNIVVPDTFTWTLGIKDSSPLSTCYLFGDEPSVGSCKPYYWYHHKETNTWHKTYPSAGLSVNFACYIVALQRESIILPGDFDGSRIIDLKDFAVLSNHWQDTNVDDSNDIILDHVVDLLDLEFFATYWLYDFRCIPCRQSCQHHLKGSGYGLQYYSLDNSGDFPDSLQDYIDYMGTDDEDMLNYLFCPCSEDPVGAVSYAYRGSGRDDSSSGSVILMYDKAGNHAECPEFINVLFADGHVGTMSQEQLQSAIAEDNQWRVTHGLPELPME